MRRLGLVIAAGLFAAAAGLAAWSYWPEPVQRESIELTAQDLSPDYPAGGAAPTATTPTAATLTLEWPGWMRAGESRAITLRLAPGTPAGGYRLPVGVDHLVVETRLDIASLAAQPAGTAQQAWLAARPLQFTWTIRPLTPGTYEGSVWFTLVFIQRDGGVLARKDISAQSVMVKAVDLAGLPVGQVRWAAVAFGAAGFLAGWWGLQAKGKSPGSPVG